MKTTPIKVLTLFCFVSLIAAYVAYSAGAFSGAAADISGALEEESEWEYDTLPPDAKDTLIPNSSGLIMSGSKSAVVRRGTTKPARLVKVKKKKKDPEPSEIDIIPSSKSGAIFQPSEPAKEQQPIMRSSKSGKVFTPPQ